MNLTALTDAVTKTEGAEASAKALIVEFAKYVEAHKDDPAALQALVDRINSGYEAGQGKPYGCEHYPRTSISAYDARSGAYTPLPK